jgi:hypothetical protein
MKRDDLAKKLDALEPGDCLRVSLRDFVAMFCSATPVPDEASVVRAAAFAEEHSCRFLYYEFLHREPEFFKTIC